MRDEASRGLVPEALEDAGAPDKVCKYDGGHAAAIVGAACEKQKARHLLEEPGFALSLVGVAGFELATPCTPCKCATRLRYTPTKLAV